MSRFILCYIAFLLILFGGRVEETPKKLHFRLSDKSKVDRGYGQYMQNATYVESPIYRYQDEGWAECLYIYDDCGTLKGRIVNPEYVKVN